jgi:chromate transporter
MHRLIVDEKGWLNEKQYLNALSFCMLLPGPEAMQLATYAGWRMHGVRGGLVAGLLFVLPGAAVILALSIIYALYGNASLLASTFLGIKAAVLVIVLEALLRVARRSLKLKAHWIIAGLAFAALFFLNLPFPLIILAAAMYGLLTGLPERESPEVDSQPDISVSVSPARTIRTVAIWLTIWFVPIIAIYLMLGNGILTEIGIFFSKLATVTFGGAYAVLAYMAQDSVDKLGWLTAAEMMDGLGLAETTPGPLILVTEFVGFLAGARANGSLSIAMGLAAAGVTLWVTFAPCFLWVFAGAPYIEWLGSKPRLSAGLAAISAAVVGVILNLSVWFALHVLFESVVKRITGPFTLWLPELTSLNLSAAVIAGIAGVLLLVRHWSVLMTLATCAALGLVTKWLLLVSA